MLPLAKSTRFSANLLQLRLHLQSLTTVALPIPNSITPVNESHLIRVCTVLYEQQNSSDARFQSKLSGTQFELSHEFFLQVCNRFPYSWQPIYRFHQYSLSQLNFAHTPTTFNKMLDIVGKSRNIDLFWTLCQESGRLQLVNIKTYIIALKTLAAARELKKCVEFFHLTNASGYEYNIEIFNRVVEILCRNKLVEEANYISLKLKNYIKADGETYRWLIHGFCEAGNLIEASKLWNSMSDEGLEPDINTIEIIIDRLFKSNKLREALKLYRSMRTNNIPPSTYRLLIKWLCNKGKMGEAQFIYDEMRTKGIEPDNKVYSSILCGLMSKGRINEGYVVFNHIRNPNISVYNGMIKGLLRFKNPTEATRVFREMAKRGCEPTMHTYVMLLQGHMGKRGRAADDPLVNFDTIFLGGLVRVGKSYETSKYVERVIDRGVEVPRFDYNKFLKYFSNEEGVEMFEAMAKKLREVGLFDLADIFEQYGMRMATRDRRRHG